MTETTSVLVETSRRTHLSFVDSADRKRDKGCRDSNCEIPREFEPVYGLSWQDKANSRTRSAETRIRASQFPPLSDIPSTRSSLVVWQRPKKNEKKRRRRRKRGKYRVFRRFEKLPAIPRATKALNAISPLVLHDGTPSPVCMC